MVFISLAPRREAGVENRIRDILVRFVNQKFNDVTITAIETQYEVDGRRADIAVLKDDGKPILIIEAKKKYEARGYRVERRFIPTSEEVVGQAVAYAALLKKKKGIHVPFVATVNERQLALFTVPENIEDLVNWDAVEKRDYGRVLKNFYEFVDEKKNQVLHKTHNFSEDFFKELLDTVTGIYKERYGVEEKRQELHWILLEDLRSFVDFMAPYIQEAIAPGGRFRDDIARSLEDYSRRTGYTPTPEGLAREMAYVLMNKIVFYKVLERYYNLEKLEPLYEKGIATSCSTYLGKLREFFEKAIKVSRDFEGIFRTGIYDSIYVIENEEVLKALDWLIRLLDHYQIERFGDIVGFVYEELISGEERHRLGQFYTPKPIAELIVRWCIRSPDDKVLDPGCGSGTFLVEAYKGLAELKLEKSFKEIKHVPGDVHRQILRQLYGVDINEFPAHLTAMNLAMKNVRVPSDEMNIFVRDYFTLIPGQKLLAPYAVKTPEGERQAKVEFVDFDAVVGNPPYTRWTEIPEETRRHIQGRLGGLMTRYNLTPQVARGVEPGIYVYWVMHSTGFLKEGGRLGMIISDSWLQTDYGVNFFKFLLDHYKVHAVIDISARVFPVPLIGTCVILLEKSTDKASREGTRTVLAYLDVSRGTVDVGEILELLEDVRGGAQSGQTVVRELASGARIVARVYTQKELGNYSGKLVNLIFKADDVLELLRGNPVVRRLSDYFEPSYGNIRYLYLTSTGTIRGVRNVGGEEFFYLTEERARQHGIPRDFLYPLLPSSRYLRFFTFTESDWEELRREGAECYLFLCRRRRDELPESVRRYIELGEGPNARIRLRRRPGEPEGRPVSESLASQVRREHRNLFFDWYDLGGVVEAPVYIARGARYWVRFVLAEHQCALDDRVLALIPRRGVQFSDVELRALLAYLNSSFTQLQAEVRGRTAGGVALLELDVKPLGELLVLDVAGLPREEVERLAGLFDRLEAEARRLGGADVVENVFGSELARELTGRNDVRQGVEGLFNTVIKDIDREVARILGLEHLVETVRTLALDMVRRRLSRAGEARREAIRGTEEVLGVREPRRRRRREGSRIQRSLDEFIVRES